MKPTPSLLLTLLLLAAGCANPVEEKVTSTWPDGSPKEVHLTEEGLEGHEIQQFHANGKLHLRGRLVGGQRDGTWNTYRENGQPWSQNRARGEWTAFSDANIRTFALRIGTM